MQILAGRDRVLETIDGGALWPGGWGHLPFEVRPMAHPGHAGHVGVDDAIALAVEEADPMRRVGHNLGGVPAPDVGWDPTFL